MSIAEFYDEETAPEESRDDLKVARERNGFLPNIFGLLAGSPAALGGYLSIMNSLEKSTLSEQQKQALFLTVSRQNECPYCTAAHTAQGQACGLSAEIIESIREGKGPQEAKLYALTEFTRQVICKQGFVTNDEVETFLGAGYSKSHILDVIAVIAAKTITTYANHIFKTPLDEELVPFKIEI